MLGEVVWDLKGKTIDMEIEKQMFGEQMFAGPSARDSVTERSLSKLC